jgi:hypothetical protein
LLRIHPKRAESRAARVRGQRPTRLTEFAGVSVGARLARGLFAGISTRIEDRQRRGDESFGDLRVFRELIGAVSAGGERPGGEYRAEHRSSRRLGTCTFCGTSGDVSCGTFRGTLCGAATEASGAENSGTAGGVL